MNATTAPAAPAGHNLRRGLWSINISMVGFVAGDTVVKLLGRSFPATELPFARSVIIVAVLAAIMFVTGRPPRLKVMLARRRCWRAPAHNMADCYFQRGSAIFCRSGADFA